MGAVNRNELAGRRILVVEDEPLQAMDYCSGLSEAGADIVGPFTSSAQALASLDKSKIDVAVLDYALADQNSETLQGALELRGIPYVVVSGYPRVLVRRDDGQDVLTKPVSPDALRTAILEACR